MCMRHGTLSYDSVGMHESHQLAVYGTERRIHVRAALSGRCSGTMSIISWIILGLIAGFIGSRIVNKQGEGMLLDMALGIVGAIVGGILFSFFGATGITGLNIWSMIVAIVGSVVVLWVYHAISDRRTI